MNTRRAGADDTASAIISTIAALAAPIVGVAETATRTYGSIALSK
jgi:hypothetical protein